MSVITISDFSFTYDGSYDPVFEHLSLQLDTDWRTGLVGRNGRGKTTLLRLLTGELTGRGRIHASVRFDYFPFPVDDPSRPAAEILYEHLPETPFWELAREMNRLSLPEELLDRPFDTLSGGERTKLMLAALFVQENNFLLIDEPTNHLDAEGRAMLADYLRTKSGFILVSHDRAFLDGSVDHILALNRAGVEIQQGNFSSWYENRRRQDAFEQTENDRLRREIRHLEDAARQRAEWANRAEAAKIGTGAYDRGFIGHKAAKVMARSKAIENRQQAAIDEKSGLLKNLEKVETLKLTPLIHRQKVLVELRDLRIAYGDTPLCEGFRMDVEAGERIALSGPNGCGKSSILKLILGQNIPHTGQVLRAPGLVISWVPQDSSFLRGSVYDYARACGVDETQMLTILRKLDFARVQFEKDMSDYSAGQKKKVLLARSLCERAHLYIWDEPLNYIDVFSRMQLEELIRDFAPTLLFVEHDRRFVEDVATQEVRM